jgi:hypothetical protein
MVMNFPSNLPVVGYKVHGLNRYQIYDRLVYAKHFVAPRTKQLTNDNLIKLICLSDDYFAFGLSAMDSSVWIIWSVIRQNAWGTAALIRKNILLTLSQLECIVS